MKQIDDSPQDLLDSKRRRMAGGKDGTGEQSAKYRSVNQTALTPEDIKPEEIYRIAVIGFLLEPRELPGVVEDAYKSIFNEHQGPRIALHAGQVAGRKPWPTGADEVRKAAATHKVAVLFEASMGSRGAYKAFEPGKEMLPVEIYQRFADSKQANADPAMVVALVEDCGPDRERTINLAGLRLGLLVCGENNVLTNEQDNGNRALVRHQPDSHLFEHVRVVFNGAHTNMGNWGKLDRRFRYLSRERRWAFYATNCGNEAWGRSTVRGYYNGRLIMTSSGPQERRVNGVRVQRIADDESKDRYMALVFDIPGRLLMAT